MTTEKQKLIESLLEMQKTFIACEQAGEISVKDYFSPDGDHPLAGYAGDYGDKANELVDLAHEEKQSNR